MIRIITVAILAVHAIRHSNDAAIKTYAKTVLLIILIVIIEIQNYQVTLRFGDGLIALSPVLFPDIRTGGLMKRKIKLVEIPIVMSFLGYLFYVVSFEYPQVHFLF